METKQRNHIENNLDHLAHLTDVHSLLLAYLESKHVFVSLESNFLNSIQNRIQKSTKFYKNMMEKCNSYKVLCDALQETNQSGALQILMKLNSIRFDVRQPVCLFTGREEQLSRIHRQMINGESTTTLVTQKSSVTGLGGIGKTELCQKYIEEYSDYYDDNIIWIGAENPNLMASSFKTLAKDYLSISLKDADDREKNIESIVDEVYNYFQDRKCLFVFDNAVSSNDTHLEKFMPVRVRKPPNILITSRDKDWELPFNTLELDELTELEALKFVKKGLKIHDSAHDNIISELVNRLQHFPLAIQQAISFISEQRIKRPSDNIGVHLAEYLGLFETESKGPLNFEIPSFLSNKYAKTTFTTWKLTTDMIFKDAECGELAMGILNMISYFQADQIPISFFEKPDDQEHMDTTHSALQLLVKYSMISCQASVSLSVHRLVQEVTRIVLKETKDEELFLNWGLSLLKGRIDKGLVEHAKSVFEYASQYKKLVDEFSTIPLSIIVVTTDLYNFENAQKLGIKYFKIFDKYFSPNHINRMDLEYKLATTSYRQRMYDGYRDDWMYDRFLRLFNVYIENGHYSGKESEVLDTASHMADLLEHKGNFEEAWCLASCVFELQKEKFGINSIDVIETAYTPFVILLKTQKFEEALLWTKQIMHSYAEAGYEIPPATSNSVYSITLGTNCEQFRRYIDMRKYFLSELSLHMISLVKINVKWEHCAWKLADHFVANGNIQTGIDIATTIHKCNEKVNGPDHPKTLIALHSSANFKIKLGQYKEAIDILKRLKIQYPKVFPKSPEYLSKVLLGVTQDYFRIFIYSGGMKYLLQFSE